MFFVNPSWRLGSVLAACLSVSACGGGSGSTAAPSISELRVRSLQYGKPAQLQVAGKYLRSDMVAEAGSCANPSFSESSTADLAILTCQVTAVGDIPLRIRSATGDLLYSTTLNVPMPEVTLITASGSMVMALAPDKAPLSVNNFLAYVNKGYYRDTLFHRVIPGFVIQAGGYTSGMVKKDGQDAPIALESNTGLRNQRATVAMARTAVPDSATSEFYINLVDNSALDYQDASNPGYAVFGTVVQGMDVVDAIAATPTATTNGFADVPTTDIPISLMFQTR